MSKRHPPPEPRPFPLFSPFPLIGISSWLVPPIEPRRERRSPRR
jgi:hypothetical protein